MQIIGLNSFNLLEDPKFVAADVADINYETLFSLDKAIRQAVLINPFASWPEISNEIIRSGFSIWESEADVIKAGHNVLWHSRQWDEHLTSSANSFFVTFPDDGPAEIRRKVFFATTYANLFSILSTDHLPSNALLLINGESEVLYPDDLVWADNEQLHKVHIGPIHIFREQFATEREFDFAHSELVRSGYLVTAIAQI